MRWPRVDGVLTKGNRYPACNVRSSPASVSTSANTSYSNANVAASFSFLPARPTACITQLHTRSLSTTPQVSIEQKYQKKTQREHVLLRPEPYLGSMTIHEEQTWVVLSAGTAKIAATMELKSCSYYCLRFDYLHKLQQPRDILSFSIIPLASFLASFSCLTRSLSTLRTTSTGNRRYDNEIT